MPAYNISTTDIKNDVLRKCGEVTDGTSTYETDGRVMDYINKAYVKVLAAGNEYLPEMSKPWTWAIEPSKFLLTLLPTIETSLVSVTQNSVNITISPAPATSIQGYWVKISDRPEWFKVATHTAGMTAATLDQAYTDVTIANTSLIAAPLEYTLNPTNGILRLAAEFITYRPQSQQGDNQAKIYQADEKTMLREYPMIWIEAGVPTQFCVTSRTQDGVYSVRFNKFSIDPTRVEVPYIKNPNPLIDSSSNYPLIPVAHRDILVFIAANMLLTDKNDDRAPQYMALAQQAGKALIGGSEKEKIQSGKHRGQLLPRADVYWRGRRFITQETS